MNRPTIATQLFDTTGQVTYRVLAYRSLTREEMHACIAAYRRTQKKKKTQPGSSVIIETLIGMA